MITILYIIGYIVCYIILRKVVRDGYKDYENENYSWRDIILLSLLSLTSWIGIVVILLMTLSEKLSKLFKNGKPPKWL